jgi:3-hydroxybutyrate dehydrogenase
MIDKATGKENKMEKSLAGKSALVTGSTSGIGRAIAERFAREGADVMLNGFGDAKEIESLRAGLEKLGVKAAYHGADMTRPAEIADMVAQAGKAFGRVDIVVNNAGIQHVSPVEDFPIDKWDAIIAIDLSSAFHATRAALPGMKRNRWGRIINIGSIHSLVGSAYKSAYSAAKHGLLGFTKALALEVAEQGITANVICPGYAGPTPIIEMQIKDQSKAHGIPEENVIRDIILAHQPTKQFVKLEDIAALAVFLATDAAASISGAALPIDGAWTAR